MDVSSYRPIGLLPTISKVLEKLILKKISKDLNMYVLYTSDLPTSRETTLGTLAGDTAIFATYEDHTIASLNLQEHLRIIEKWLKKWKIKVKESKSSQIKFTLRKGHCPAVNINQTIIPQNRSSKIPRTTLRLQVQLERTHRQ
jgi:hypothetical protein